MPVNRNRREELRLRRLMRRVRRARLLGRKLYELSHAPPARPWWDVPEVPTADVADLAARLAEHSETS